MVTSRLMSNKERGAVSEYLRNPTRSMPGIVRQARVSVNRINLEQIAKDLELLKRLRELDVPMGRKRNDFGETRAVFRVRHGNESSVKASAIIRP